MLDDGLTGLVAIALHDVERPRWNPGLLREAAEGKRRLGSVLGGLQDDPVAAQQRRERLPGHVRDRGIGGDDQAGDTQRLANRHGLAIWDRARRRAAVIPA